MKPIRVHPEAKTEARQALLWYWDKSEIVALRYAAALKDAYAEIKLRPRSFPFQLHGTRRKILDRFPFSVVFREQSDTIQIIAVAHAKRRPGCWKNRL
jgi:toxin ParE1/3/4